MLYQITNVGNGPPAFIYISICSLTYVRMIIQYYYFFVVKKAWVVLVGLFG